MSMLVVTYRARPELADGNQARIEAVFDQLVERSPEGLRYACLRLADDTFVHIADVSVADNPLLGLDSFAEFSATVADRCEPGNEPNARPARLVADYRLFR
jgi:hypothetical protein